MSRQQDVLDARAAADEFATERSLPPSGGYSGQWYQNGYLGGWWPDGWIKWWAAYGIPAGSILGDLIVGHQFTSTPINSDVLLDSEFIGGDVPNCDTYKAAIERAVNRLQIELAKKTTLSKKLVGEIQSELFQALQA